MEDGDAVDPTTVVAEDNFYEFDGGEKVSGDRKRDEDEFCCLLLHRVEFYIDLEINVFVDAYKRS